MAVGDAFKAEGGDILITVDIGLEEIEDAQILLADIAANLENFASPMRASAGLAREDMQRRFNTETDPDENPWTALDPEYLRSKLSLGYPENILHRRGDLERAATSLDAWIIDDEGETGELFFDTDILPPYGLAHQTGSGEENIGKAADYRDRFAVAKSTGVESGKGESPHGSLGIGTGYALPRRAFIGLSQTAEVKLYKLWDLWFEDATNPGFGLKVGSSGAVQESIGGKFGPRLLI
jgi:hypothetical protein